MIDAVSVGVRVIEGVSDSDGVIEGTRVIEGLVDTV